MITQYGVIPYRLAADGAVEILLITSRERGRWVIPRGNPIPFFLNQESAAREAFEEAGVEGAIASASLGTYRYSKRRRSGAEAAAIVTVYALLVTREAPAWPEDRERVRQWFSREAAADAIEEEGLKALIRAFAPVPDDPSLVAMGVNRVSWWYRMLNSIRATSTR